MTTRKLDLSRRTLLRGMMGGAAVSMALPMLEYFMDSSGTAYAQTGQRLPQVFGTWFFGLGMTPGHWEPRNTGPLAELPEHIAAFEPIKSKMNIYSGLQIHLDGKVNQNHYSGAQGQMTGIVSRTGSEYFKSLDQYIADEIAGGTRFRSIEVGCDTDRRSTWSARGANSMNSAEISPVELYARLFGSDFVDPNVAEFQPDPRTMVRHSVMSAVGEQRRALFRQVSGADRARLDEYFTSVRELEQQFAVELERPTPMPSCTVPPEIDSEDLGNLVEQTRNTHRQFVQLIAHALACGQTRVFNIAMGSGFSPMRIPDEVRGYHALTHEERIDPDLGYQVKVRWLAERHMEFWVDLVQTLDSIQEGDNTLLDRAAILGFTDHGNARIHAMDHIPVMTAGSAGGRLRTGQHISAEGDACTRVGLTLLRAYDVSMNSWGTESNFANRPFTDALTSEVEI